MNVKAKFGYNVRPLLCLNTVTPKFSLKLLICKGALRQLIVKRYTIFLKNDFVA